jgi:GNAT superfamily N-acetyltransferase
VELRRATVDDVVAVRVVVERAYAPYVARLGRRPGPMDDDHAAQVAQVAGEEVWLAELDGAVAGVLVLVPGDDHLLLHNVAVDPAHHGAGLGTALLDLAEERARTLGLGAVRLYTHVPMTENQARYERRGYVETHRGGPPGLARVHYEKRLG